MRRTIRWASLCLVPVVAFMLSAGTTLHVHSPLVHVDGRGVLVLADGQHSAPSSSPDLRAAKTKWIAGLCAACVLAGTKSLSYPCAFAHAAAIETAARLPLELPLHRIDCPLQETPRGPPLNRS